MKRRAARWVTNGLGACGSFVLVACARHAAPAPAPEAPRDEFEVVSKEPEAEAPRGICVPLPPEPPRCVFTSLAGLPHDVSLHAVSAAGERIFAIGSRQDGAKRSTFAITAELDGASLTPVQVDEWKDAEPMQAHTVSERAALLGQRARSLELVDRKSAVRQVVSSDEVVWAALEQELVAFVPAARSSDLSLIPLDSGQALPASARTISILGGRPTALPRFAGEGPTRRLFFASEKANCGRAVACGDKVLRRESCIELRSASLLGTFETQSLSLPLDVFSLGGVVQSERETAIFVGIRAPGDACERTRPVATSASSTWVDPMHATKEECPAGTGLDLALLLGDGTDTSQIVQFGSDREDVPVSLAPASKDGAYWVSWCAPVANTQSCYLARIAPRTSEPDAEVCLAGAVAHELVASGSGVIAFAPGHHEILRLD